MLHLPVDTDKKLAELLKAKGLVAPDKISQAETESTKSGNGLIATLIEQKAVTETQILEKLIEIYNLKKINISESMVYTRPLKEKFTDHVILKHRVIPFKFENNILSIAIADNKAMDHIEEVKKIAGVQVDLHATGLSMLENYLLKLTSNKQGTPSGMQNFMQASAPQGASPTGATQGGVLSPKDAFMNKLAQSPDAAGQAGAEGGGGGSPKSSGSDVIDFVDNMIENAVLLGVSDIHVEVFEEEARLRYRVDGVLQNVEEYGAFLSSNYNAIVTRIKILSSLDISERRLPQDGAIVFKGEEVQVDLRVSVLPTSFGERIVMRVIDKSSLSLPLDKLGFPEKSFDKLMQTIASPQGLILVTGPTGSGKSTTLYAILNQLNTMEQNILTAEDPVEYNLTGIGQVHVKENIGLTFSSALRSFLRQDPEVIMVGEIRDKETSDISIKAALTGHLVLSTLHTNDAPSTVSRLLNMGVATYLVSSALSMVVSQRLARVICKDCKEVDETVGKDKLMALGFKEEEAATIKAYKGKGCVNCFEKGVKGRRAIHEILFLTEDIKEAILKDSTEREIREIARKDGFQTMQDIGKGFIKEGVISIEEYQRVLVLD